LTWHVEPYVAWQKLEPAVVEGLARVMRARLKAMGATGTVTADQRRRTLSVRVARIDPTEQRLLGAQARLELYDLEPALLPPSISGGLANPTEPLASLLRGTHGVNPPHSVVITCSAKTAEVCPGDPNGVPASGMVDYYLFKYGPYPGDAYGPYP